MAERVSPRSVGPGTSNGPRGSTSRVMPGASPRFVAAAEHLDDGTAVVSVMSHAIPMRATPDASDASGASSQPQPTASPHPQVNE